MAMRPPIRKSYRSVWFLLSLGVLVGMTVRDWSSLALSHAQSPRTLSEVNPNDPSATVATQRPPTDGAGSSRRPGVAATTGDGETTRLPDTALSGPDSKVDQRAGAQLGPGVPLTAEEQISVRVYEVCNHSVVHIATKARMDSFLTVTTREGSGSGSIIDDQGHVLTNYHVIEGAREVTVSLHNGSSYPGAVVGQDTETDIAVVKIDAPAKELHQLAWGDSSNLRVGQRIYAIGNPFGLERTMSTGIISSLNRQIPAGQHRTMRSLIQLDVSLNQGNSGGPLINTSGELIGMNTAIMSTNGDSAGVGFAIPVSTIRRIVPQLIRDGRVVRPTIGITRVYENDGGLLIVSVVPGGPAEKAGLRGFSLKTKTFKQGPFRYEQPVVDPKGADLITAAEGKPVRTADELLAIIEGMLPKSVVNLTIVRDGRTQTARVVLGSSDPAGDR